MTVTLDERSELLTDDGGSQLQSEGQILIKDSSHPRNICIMYCIRRHFPIYELYKNMDATMSHFPRFPHASHPGPDNTSFKIINA